MAGFDLDPAGQTEPVEVKSQTGGWVYPLPTPGSRCHKIFRWLDQNRITSVPTEDTPLDHFLVLNAFSHARLHLACHHLWPRNTHLDSTFVKNRRARRKSVCVCTEWVVGQYSYMLKIPVPLPTDEFVPGFRSHLDASL